MDDLAAPVGVHDFGVELQPEEPALRIMHGRHGRAGAGGGGEEPSGTAVMASPWLIQTLDVAGQSVYRGEAPVCASSVRPYSPWPVHVTVPPSCCAMSCAP